MSAAQPHPSVVSPVGARLEGTLLDQPRHDGSARYLPDPPQEHGDPFTVLLCTSPNLGPSRVHVRVVIDGEAEYLPAEIVGRDPGRVWWAARLHAHNPVTHYRFETDAGPAGFQVINAAGVWDFEVTDAADFRVSLPAAATPAWLAEAVAYQIFPDRFARSAEPKPPTPAWAEPANWDDPLDLRSGHSHRQLYGGDLAGIAAHLDHLASLGVNLIYLTPVFPAQSNHRYNATAFEHIDPLLGGDGAYRQLIDAAHARGMRVIGDLTTNHTGSGHEWFSGPQARPDFYYYDSTGQHVGWQGHASLPKLDLANEELRDRLISGPGSVVARWLEFGLDGWRIDVANMTGRYGPHDHNRAVAGQIRATMAAVNPSAYLLAEHFWDARDELDGTGWHGAMNYAGFARPIWSWLGKQPTYASPWSSLPHLPGTSAAATMSAFSSLPWPARLANLNLIGTHDTPRVADMVSDPALVEVAYAAMFGFPGVPLIYYGDEIGLSGAPEFPGVDSMANRQPFPWERPSTWDDGILGAIRALSAVRRDSSALRRGGLRWAYVDHDRLAWLREDPQEAVLVFLARRAGSPVRLSGGSLGLADGNSAQNLYGGATLSARQGLAELPATGPTAQIWRLPAPRWAPSSNKE